MNNKIEYRFMLSFYQLINISDINKNDKLLEICEIMNIKISFELLINKYRSYKRGKGDFIVFKNNFDEDAFILLDLYKGYSDQSNMVEICVRCNENISSSIKEILEKIYIDSHPKTEFIEDDKNTMKGILEIKNFPKKIEDKWLNKTNYQHLECYVDNELIYKSN